MLPWSVYTSVTAKGSRPALMDLLMPAFDFSAAARIIYVDARDVWTFLRNRRQNAVWGMLMGGI
jgi:hypothetical protein